MATTSTSLSVTVTPRAVTQTRLAVTVFHDRAAAQVGLQVAVDRRARARVALGCAVEAGALANAGDLLAPAAQVIFLEG